jgi:phosphoglycerol transferase MdoB-like AlkP superfamily enzyme
MHLSHIVIPMLQQLFTCRQVSYVFEQIIKMMLQVFDDDFVIVVGFLTCDNVAALSYLRCSKLAVTINRSLYQ